MSTAVYIDRTRCEDSVLPPSNLQHNKVRIDNLISQQSCFTIPSGTRGILFDLNGTISDSETAYREALRLASERLFKIEIPQNGWRKIQTRWSMSDIATCRSTIKALSRLYPEVKLGTDPRRLLAEQKLALMQENPKLPLKSIPGVTDLINALNASRIRVALVTGSSELDAAMTLKRLGFTPQFSRLVSTRDLAADQKKPSPYSYNLALMQMGLRYETANCIALEDSLSGTMAAYAAGLTTLVKVGRESAEHFKQNISLNALKLNLSTPNNNKRGQIILLEDWSRIDLSQISTSEN